MRDHFAFFQYLREQDIKSYLIIPPARRRKPLLFNTLHVSPMHLHTRPPPLPAQVVTRARNWIMFEYLQVRSAMLPGGAKRRPSFKMVSNMVIQLLHSIKYSVEVPFSNMAQQPVDIQKGTMSSNSHANKKVKHKYINGHLHTLAVNFHNGSGFFFIPLAQLTSKCSSEIYFEPSLIYWIFSHRKPFPVEVAKVTHFLPSSFSKVTQ